MTPPVTIGMPVRNGSDYLEEAIRSLLSQTESEFSLHISDNCSDDATPEICARLAGQDARIRYEVQSRNLGAAGNFEYLLRSAQTEFFMWAAHDDLRDPTFLATSLRLLRGAPDAVGSSVGVRMIDATGAEVKRVLPPSDLASYRCIDRVRAVNNKNGHLAVYGLMRTDRLPGDLHVGDFFGSDVAFAFRMALSGRIVTTDEILITYRLLNVATRTGGAEPYLYDYSRTPTPMYMSMARDVDHAAFGAWMRVRLRLHIAVRWLASARHAAINRNVGEIHRARLAHHYGSVLLRSPVLLLLAPRVIIERIRRQMNSSEHELNVPR